MASVLYPAGREGFLDGSLDWDTDDIRAMLVLATYVYDAGDRYVADLGSVDNGRSAALSGKTVAAGVADAEDTSLVATTAAACSAIVIYKHTGLDTTARLIAYIDTGTGLPVTPAAGQTVNLAWSNAAERIFRI